MGGLIKICIMLFVIKETPQKTIISEIQDEVIFSGQQSTLKINVILLASTESRNSWTWKLKDLSGPYKEHTLLSTFRLFLPRRFKLTDPLIIDVFCIYAFYSHIFLLSLFIFFLSCVQCELSLEAPGMFSLTYFDLEVSSLFKIKFIMLFIIIYHL